MNTVIALGKNWRAYPPKEPDLRFRLRLSIESKLTALAAGEMYRRGEVTQIIFSSGATAGSGFPSEAKAMAEYLFAHCPEVPRSVVRLEERSIDTAGNAEEIARMGYAHNALDLIYLLSVRFHFPRAAKLFEEYGVHVVPRYSEEILDKRSSHHRRLVRSYKRSLRYRFEELKEVILRLERVLLCDFDGRLLRKVTKYVRHTK